MAEVTAVLGRGVIPADETFLAGDDLGVLRGDGVFETANVRAGEPFLLEEHLARMVRSAERMQLDLPDVTKLAELAADACQAFGKDREGALRIICTRGPEGGGPPTVYMTLNPVPAAMIAARRDGLNLAVLSLGYPVDVRGESPWLLGGAKCLSYAVAMAAQRHAKATGHDDLLWRSEDGFALEGPTSTLIWQQGDTLYTVPSDTGILVGTTAKFVFDRAREAGIATAERRVQVAELIGADGIWMTSSVRGIAPVHTLDNVSINQSDLSATLSEFGGFPVPTS
ncbi:aminotransferase class IV [Stackebrandtia endophytica]|uniref:aminotransferase class IV n=1 Tax=Stackebrandtia endophytica TaxID=1496996 RepID=UPI0011547983|nr:aminotransferase class IV [Stackebrandtia endophytica]